MKVNINKIIPMLVLVFLLLSIVSVKTYAKTPQIPKASTSDVSIKNVYNKEYVVFSNEAPYSKGANGKLIEVSRVKDGKIVATLDLGTPKLKVKKNVFYRYRICYYYEEKDVRTVGEWSDYRYFYIPSVSGKSKPGSITLKWKKMPNTNAYDIYYYVATNCKGKYGNMNVSNASTSMQPIINKTTYKKWKKIKTVSKNKTSITITTVGKKKLSKKNKYYFRVVPRQYVNGKRVENDIYTMIYK